jgi:hypothetical protein
MYMQDVLQPKSIFFTVCMIYSSNVFVNTDVTVKSALLIFAACFIETLV